MMTALLDDETVGNLNDGNECLEKPMEISGSFFGHKRVPLSKNIRFFGPMVFRLTSMELKFE